MGWRFVFAMPLMAAASWWICTTVIGQKEATLARDETDCVRYIKKALPQIITTWDYEEWNVRASSELQNSVRPKRVKANFANYKRMFGEMLDFETPIGRVETDDRGGIHETVGFYTAFARFENGRANITMRLVKRAGGWKFQQFRVRSDMVPSGD